MHKIINIHKNIKLQHNHVLTGLSPCWCVYHWPLTLSDTLLNVKCWIQYVKIYCIHVPIVLRCCEAGAAVKVTQQGPYIFHTSYGCSYCDRDENNNVLYLTRVQPLCKRSQWMILLYLLLLLFLGRGSKVDQCQLSGRAARSQPLNLSALTWRRPWM